MANSAAVYEILKQARALFEQHSNPERATAMAAYMKNHFVFFGIASSRRRAISTDILRDRQWREEDALLDFAQACWQEPEREWQYLGLDLLVKHKKRLTPISSSVLEQLICEKSWWDTVDALASHSLGTLHQNFPAETRDWIDRWRVSDKLWLRRSCLLYQLKYKNDTDLVMQRRLIEENLANRDFFIQKAIGWSLREIAKTNPEWVKQTVDELGLDGLARREALKHM